MMNRIISVLVLLGAALSGTEAFAPPSSHTVSGPSSRGLAPVTVATTPSTSSTALNERQWNFNQGRSPWGLKKNAEIWNGRVAQMAFVTVLLQELITGKGVIASIQDHDLVGYAFLGLAGVSTLGITLVLALKGDESDVIF